MEVWKLFHLNTNSYRSQSMYAPGNTWISNPMGKCYPSNAFDQHEDIKQPFSSVVAGRSTHDFDKEKPVTKQELFSLLHMCYFVQHDETEQHGMAPSAGGLFPIEFYVIALDVPDLAPGIYHYQKNSGSLSFLRNWAGELSFLPNINRFANTSSFLIVMTAQLENVVNKYGSRGYRYALIECGHLGQNLSIACAKSGFGCCAIGGYYDQELNDLLNLQSTEVSLYLYAIGRSCESVS